MKWPVLIMLLLMNVVYLGWELLRETSMAVQGVRALQIPAAAKQLELLTERSALPALRETAEINDEQGGEALAAELLVDNDEAVKRLLSSVPRPLDVALVSAAEGVGTAACFRFGPIPEALQAMTLSDWFSARKARAGIRPQQRQARRLFWIYLAPQQSRQTALAMLDELKGKGISDYRLIGHGSLRNAISLGLFSSQAAINKRLGELQQKGYRPVVVPYDNVRRVYWVDVQLQAGQALEELLKGRPARYRPAPVDCSEIAMSLANP